jgi:lysophospholipase L1-like esterase
MRSNAFASRSAFLVAFAVARCAAGSDCSMTSLGLVPLHDLGNGQYQGFSGGLYPNGANQRPLAHDAKGLALAQSVVPRNALGQPDPNGRIVFISIGMSNATMEFSTFVALANADPAKNPRVDVIDCAQGGQTAAAIADPQSAYWQFVNQKLQQAGRTPAQVQAFWLKEANASPSGGFPTHAQALQSNFVAIAQNLRAKFPNGRLCYLASRIYGGYATSTLNPEPYAYEQGFAVKWMIEQQIAGDPALNIDAAAGPILSPWLAWGPYAWSDGLNARSDGLIWECQDFQPDGTHPSPLGRAKVAQLLLDFVKSDATASRWFLAAPPPLCGPQATATKYGSGAGGGNCVAQLVASDALIVPSVKNVFVQAWGAPANAAGAFLFGVSPIAPGAAPFLGGSLLVSPLAVVPAVANSFGKATLPLGVIPGDTALCGAHVYFQAVLSDADSPSGYDVTAGLDLRLGH